MRSRSLFWLAILAALMLLVAACEEDLADEPDPEDLEEDLADDEPEDEEPEPEEPDEDEVDPDAENIDWGTSDVGSAGHAALVSLADVMNREWDDYSITVQPTGGAVQTVIGYAIDGEFDGIYGADVAFSEMAEDRDRFEGFSDDAEQVPVQSFWAYPMETGLAINADNADEFQEWGDLEGEPVFTGPAPWDVRANLEAAMDALDVGHDYVEVDTGVAGDSLDGGEISGMIAYTTSELDPAPWVVEAELQTDMQILNPSDDEVAALDDAGYEVVGVDPGGFEGDVGVDEAMFVPFFYGFHLGMEYDADTVYEKLDLIAEHAEDLAAANEAFSVLADDPAELQARGVAASIDDIEVHPGMAEWMDDQGVWDDAWDDRIAE